MEDSQWVCNNEMRRPQSNKDKITVIECYLVERGLRLTRLRRIILEIFIKSKTHLTVTQIHLLACGCKYDFAIASIYRNVNILVSIGVVETHQFKKGHATYELAGAKSHDHLIDLDSGQIIEFQSSALDKLKAKIAKQYGYRTDACHIEFYAYPLANQSKATLGNEA